MAYYRLYFLDPRTDRIDRVAELVATDDVEAIRLAGAQTGSDAMELWCETRKICRFEAKPLPIPRAPA
jgi:hypothetical protein